MRFDVEERKKLGGVGNIDEKSLYTLETSFSLMVQYPIHELHNLLSPWGTIERRAAKGEVASQRTERDTVITMSSNIYIM